jgi:hypothetical protein
LLVIWFAVVLYLALSPVACLLVGRAIRARDAERPVAVCEPAAVTTQDPAAAQTVAVQLEIPVAS